MGICMSLSSPMAINYASVRPEALFFGKSVFESEKRACMCECEMSFGSLQNPENSVIKFHDKKSIEAKLFLFIFGVCRVRVVRRTV